MFAASPTVPMSFPARQPRTHGPHRPLLTERHWLVFLLGAAYIGLLLTWLAVAVF